MFFHGDYVILSGQGLVEARMRHREGFKKRCYLVLALSAAVFLSFAAVAESPTTSGGTPAAQKPQPTCLCLKARLESANRDLSARAAAVAERSRQLDTLDERIKAQRATLDPHDTVGRQILKSMIDEQNSLRDLIRQTLRPAHIRAVDAYNALVARYNNTCTPLPTPQPPSSESSGSGAAGDCQ